jgi:hypothetical protein
MRTKVFEKLPGEAPKVFLPEILEQETKPATEPETGPIAESAGWSRKLSEEVEAQPTRTTPTEPATPATQPTNQLSEAAQKARAVLKEAWEVSKKAEAEAQMTVRDLIRILDYRGLISYDPRQNRYTCWVCGAPFESAAQIKEHFANGVEVSAVDMDALAADARRARSCAALDARVDRFLGDGDSGDNGGDEVLVVGRCAKGCFYRAVLALCRGRTVKIVPPGKRAWNVATLVKRVIGNGVSAAKADGGVRLSLSLLPKTPARIPTSQ